MSQENKDIENQTSSYRSIFKATSLFGGVQVYQILIGIIKSKFVAVLLGPAGMGIQGLYQSALQLIQGISSLGLSQSAVRDVSEANGTGDAYRIGRKVAVLRRLVWYTGLLGLIATALLSPILSKTTFGNYDYTLPFIVLSVTLLLDQLSAGQRVVLQGLRRLKYLAKASAIGSTVGLIVSVPLYYLLGVQGIVPTLILHSVTSLLLSWWFSRRVNIEKVSVTHRESLVEGRTMLRMGIAMSMTTILGTATAYLLRSFIRYDGGEDQVGLFVAGFYIMNYYTGLVFNAMGTDFYPRLAAVNKDNQKCKTIINQQGEIALLIIGPLLLGCLIFMPFIIRLLYSQEFLPAMDYIFGATVGMLFKAASWVISYSFVAKGEAKLFIWNELIGTTVTTSLYLIGYLLWGLLGLGFGVSVGFTYYLLQVFIIAKKRYDFAFMRSFKFIFVVQFVFVVVCLLIVKLWDSPWAYLPTCTLLLGCMFFSLKELDRRMDVMSIIKKKIRHE